MECGDIGVIIFLAIMCLVLALALVSGLWAVVDIIGNFRDDMRRRFEVEKEWRNGTAFTLASLLHEAKKKPERDEVDEAISRTMEWCRGAGNGASFAQVIARFWDEVNSDTDNEEGDE